MEECIECLRTDGGGGGGVVRRGEGVTEEEREGIGLLLV